MEEVFGIVQVSSLVLQNMTVGIYWPASSKLCFLSHFSLVKEAQFYNIEPAFRKTLFKNCDKSRVDAASARS